MASNISQQLSLYRNRPSTEDVAKVHSQINVHEMEIAHLDEQVAELVAKIRAIQGTKAEQLRMIARLKGIITPARLLPPEILQKIFECCVDDGWTRAPVVLSQICSSWRFACMSPTIWSDVYIDGDNGSPILRAFLWVRRSQGVPLHITVNTSQSIDTVSSSLALLRQHIRRWKSFKINTASAQVASQIIQACSGYAINLGEVSITTTDEAGLASLNPEEPEGQILTLGEAFAHAPLLSKLSITSSVLQSISGYPSQLRTLRLELLPYPEQVVRPIFSSEIVRILQHCTHLEELYLKIPQSDDRAYIDNNQGTQPISTALLVLELELPPSLLLLLHLITAPNLQELRLKCPDNYTFFASGPIQQLIGGFIQETNALRLIELYDLDVSQDDHLFMFRHCSYLEEIRLHGSDIHDATIQALVDDGDLCPRLSKLDLRWCGHLSGQVLVDLVKSREVEVHGTTRELGNQVARTSSISSMTIINCPFVKESHILDIAEFSVFWLYTHDPREFCRSRGCCENIRYRQRFQFRRQLELSALQRSRLRLY